MVRVKVTKEHNWWWESVKKVVKVGLALLSAWGNINRYHRYWGRKVYTHCDSLKIAVDVDALKRYSFSDRKTHSLLPIPTSSVFEE